MSYDRLRSIGVSVETADAIAPILDSFSPKKREAFFLWAMGYSQADVILITGISKGGLWRLLKEMRGKCL